MSGHFWPWRSQVWLPNKEHQRVKTKYYNLAFYFCPFISHTNKIIIGLSVSDRLFILQNLWNKPYTPLKIWHTSLFDYHNFGFPSLFVSNIVYYNYKSMAGGIYRASIVALTSCLTFWDRCLWFAELIRCCVCPTGDSFKQQDGWHVSAILEMKNKMACNEYWPYSLREIKCVRFTALFMMF